MVAAGIANPLTPEALVRVDELPRNLRLETTRAGDRLEALTGFSQAVPGTMVMFTLLVLLTTGSVMVVMERREGLLRRLASAPITRGEVILGKAGARFALGVVQIAFAMTIGTIFFRVRWGPDLPMLFLVLLAYGALCAVLGFFLGNLCRTEGQAVAIGVISSNVLAALGGCWWPIEVTPDWMQKFALFLPTGWAMDALHKLVSFEAGASSVLPHVIGMVVATAILGRLAARTFRFA
jgi:ABC-type multidrug transport system permease subunit